MTKEYKVQEAPYLIKPEGSKFPSGGRIACQGVEGAYSQIMASRLFPEGEILYCKTFDDVAEAVESGTCDFGVLPIENNTYGSVKKVYQLLQKGRLSIVRGGKLKIEHELLAKPGTGLKDVTHIYSHEQAIGQCSQFLKELGDGVQVTPVLNTAMAARAVSLSSEKGAAAISSPVCCRLYGLQSIKTGIADTDRNYTEFVCVGRLPEVYPEANRISISISVAHEPGALYHALKQFADLGINLYKIESTPIPGRDFEFLFYINIEGSVRNENIRSMLKVLSETCSYYRFLGNFSELESDCLNAGF